MAARAINANLTTDATFDFSSDTGWTLTGDAQIGSGVLDLDTGVTTGTAESPSLDRSMWGALVQCSISAVEDVASGAEAYFHRIAFSFDGGTNWQAFRQGVWTNISEALISGEGMAIETVQDILSWTSAATLKVLIYIERTDAGASGSMDFIKFGHGSEDVDFAAEPATDSTTLPIAPERGYTLNWEPRVASDRSERNLPSSHLLGSGVRRVGSLTFITKDTTDRDTLLAYLRSHVSTAFDFKPLCEASAGAFVVTADPTYDQIGPAPSWRVVAQIRESLG